MPFHCWGTSPLLAERGGPEIGRPSTGLCSSSQPRYGLLALTITSPMHHHRGVGGPVDTRVWTPRAASPPVSSTAAAFAAASRDESHLSAGQRAPASVSVRRLAAPAPDAARSRPAPCSPRRSSRHSSAFRRR